PGAAYLGYPRLVLGAKYRHNAGLAPSTYSIQSGVSGRAIRGGEAMAKEVIGTLGVAATFSAEPVEPALAFWWSHLRAPVDVKLAPFHQVMSQLLDQASTLNRATWRALLVRWEDWARDLNDSAALERVVSELARALA